MRPRSETLAPQGRITTDVVDQEIIRLRAAWGETRLAFQSDDLLVECLGSTAAAKLDLFDKAQLAAVIETCRSHATASAAGRTLFAHSRLEKKSSNDADRLSKYLTRFGLRFEDVRKPV